MKHERATEETRQQATLYALGILTQHEAHCFELHLEECSVCREECARLLLKVAQIGLAMKEEEPPAGFRERLASCIDSSPRIKHIPDLPGEQEPAPQFPPQKPAKTPKPEGKNESAKNTPSVLTSGPVLAERSRFRKAAIIIHTLVYAIFAAFAAFAFYTWRNIENEKAELHGRIESSEKTSADLRLQLDLLKPQLENAEKLEKFQEMFRKPSLRVARLKGQPTTPDNTGTVIWDSLTGDITVFGTFEPAPQEKVYQLWFSASPERISVGRLQPDRSGRILTTFKLNQGMTATSGISAIVTLESPEGLSTRTAPAGHWSATGRLE